MQQQKKMRHIKWDEEKLKETQKLRGTFEKIPQPKTPYRHNSDSEQDDMQGEQKTQQELQLEQSLKKAKENSKTSNYHKRVDIAALNAKLKQQLQNCKKGEEMEDEQQQQARLKRQQFKRKRADHYKQFYEIKKMKMGEWQQQQDDQ